MLGPEPGNLVPTLNQEPPLRYDNSLSHVLMTNVTPQTWLFIPLIPSLDTNYKPGLWASRIRSPCLQEANSLGAEINEKLFL